ncbi:hypothetical protein [Trujillonella endophytica]|uniref:DUF1345 domain-containing protein n=1 Tax=Trujillonella endophytica TaxID=673521 RepID=A0A1H8T0M7_9ACTN|nr:hypothetical protein [Trujillella endophytica]SEO84452.1 hypothetical protein SAMN05660991_01974 [Trujillella endophytica]
MDHSAGGDELARPESYTWPLLVVVVAVLPQAVVPAQYRVGPPLVVPVTETVALLVLLAIAARPGPVPRSARSALLVLFGLLAAANTFAAARLVTLVLGDGEFEGVELTAGRLLVAGLLVLVINVVTFALLYWELDGGGPAGRVAERAPYPDFQFPQTGTQGLAEPGWQPRFGDHLYVAFTNLVAFGPTDAMPLTRRVKGLMALQSTISLGVLVVVLARVINILPG